MIKQEQLYSNFNDIGYNVYCDECFEKDYLVLGQLIIKKTDEEYIFNNLKNSRCLNRDNNIFYFNQEDCKIKCRYHKKNNTEIHFTDLNSSIEKSKIAKKWIDLIKKDLKSKIFFKLFLVNKNKLDQQRFGNKKQIYNIYNKFFKISLGGFKKYVFGNNLININKIFHHRSSALETHMYFKNINLKQYGINLINKEIIFYSDNHHEYEKKSDIIITHFIQLIDLLIGCFIQLLTNRSKQGYKINVAEESRYIFDNINNFRNYSISFFPKYSIKELKEQSQFNLKESELNDINLIEKLLNFRGNFYNNFVFKMPKTKRENKKLGDFF